MSFLSCILVDSRYRGCTRRSSAAVTHRCRRQGQPVRVPQPFQVRNQLTPSPRLNLRNVDLMVFVVSDLNGLGLNPPQESLELIRCRFLLALGYSCCPFLTFF